MAQDRKGEIGERAAWLDALRWQIECGADEALEERPLDAFAQSRQAEPVSQAPRQQPRPAAKPAPREAGPVQGTFQPKPEALVSQDAAIAEARERAEAAQDLAALEEAIRAFDSCPLKRTATHTVIADGNPRGRVLLIGEAPGANEDRQGKPFVGEAGQLLDRMLAAIGLDRSGVCITNIFYWRPPGNRKPTPAEVAMCLPFVERFIALSDAEVLGFLGASAASSLLGRTEGVLKLRGRWFPYQNPAMASPRPALVTLHPAYLLRTPEAKRLVWRDLLSLRRVLDGREAPPLEG